MHAAVDRQPRGSEEALVIGQELTTFAQEMDEQAALVERRVEQDRVGERPGHVVLHLGLVVVHHVGCVGVGVPGHPHDGEFSDEVMPLDRAVFDPE